MSPTKETEKIENLDADIVIIGGGAGLTAAEAGAKNIIAW
jgi:hypothetical protein